MELIDIVDRGAGITLLHRNCQSLETVVSKYSENIIIYYNIIILFYVILQSNVIILFYVILQFNIIILFCTIL